MIRAIVFSIGILLSEASFADDQWRKRYVDLVLAEPKVVEAIWPNSTGSFWASVRDNGTRRDGFAEYLCLLKSDAGAPKGVSYIISIWSAAEMARGKLSKIGEFHCGF